MALNAYERRQETKKFKNRIKYLKLKDMKLHQLSFAEKYYISAFTALNGQPPQTLPKGGVHVLMGAAETLFATAHAIELGGEDDT